MGDRIVKEPAESAVIITLVDVDNDPNGRIHRLRGVVARIDELRELSKVVRATLRPKHAAGNFIANLDPSGRYTCSFQSV